MTRSIASVLSVLIASIAPGVAHAGGKVGIDPGAPDARQVAKKAPPPAKKAPAPAWRKDAPTTTSSSKQRQGIESNGAQAQGLAR